MLTLNAVEYRWPQAAESCLSGVTLAITPGEWVAMVGDNGAGKSTLLRLMAGLLAPASGHIHVQGAPLAELNASARAARIGVLFQEAENQILHSNVFDEVAWGLRLQKRPATEIARRTSQALALCGLEAVAQAHPLDLHAAQRRMVAVASLEAMAPPLMLLDEPGRDFDDRWLGIFDNWLDACRARNTTVLAISHDYAFTRQHFPRVIRLAGGKIAADGTPEQILA
nr:ATP-binding cassette domain-containing protein [uncultured Enterobacter sp.]